ETVRAYAADRLDAAGETAALRRAHAEVYLAVAEARDRQLRGHDQLDALHDLSQERDNLHAALRSATELGDGELALRLAAALGWFWCLRCERAEALEWIDRALAVAGPGPPLLRA